MCERGGWGRGGCGLRSVISFGHVVFRVYYESIKREPKIRGIKKCRCDERLQTNCCFVPSPPGPTLLKDDLVLFQGTGSTMRPERGGAVSGVGRVSVRFRCDFFFVYLFIINGESESYMENL
jgi:hypothetical protein